MDAFMSLQNSPEQPLKLITNRHVLGRRAYASPLGNIKGICEFILLVPIIDSVTSDVCPFRFIISLHDISRSRLPTSLQHARQEALPISSRH